VQPIAELPALESTAASIRSLDAQFPWLRGAEKRQRRSYGSGGRR
jgi:hypothetical protein